ncbi:MAG: glycosyltransferase family 4 protein [Abditibacteriales bacterium]|nr:glycosyltransferase family 4 protein [Abditibacteriales bacterium]MDW8365795.1 glycosyltransferase family 1 protein [Abditibacteriales bacterium]
MRIGIDARTTLSPKTGDRTYTLNLVRALAQIDAENEYFLLLDRAPPPGLLPEALNFHPLVIPTFWGRWWTMVQVPLVARRARMDVLHVQYIAPPWGGTRVVTAIHDVSFAVLPETFPLKDRLLLNFFIPLSASSAAKVITLSASSKRDLIERYGIAPEKIVITPCGVDETMRRVEDPQVVAAVLRRYGITPPFILSVGLLQPRKNLPRVVDAFARLHERRPDLPQRLVVAGRVGWGVESLRERVRARRLEDAVHFVGYVADEDLPALYSAADLFVYPSLYEGFGLPPLEAMACGTPVVTSNVSSIPEVVGDAALTVNPLDVEAIAGAMEQILTDTALRQMLTARGLERARGFTWEKTARLTLDVYREVAKQRPSSP